MLRNIPISIGIGKLGEVFVFTPSMAHPFMYAVSAGGSLVPIFLL
jgi:hypothetical protein